jgi:hypothetical protein
MGDTKILSDDGTKAAKAIAHAVALEGALAHAGFFITQLHNFDLNAEQLYELKSLEEGIATMSGSASVLTARFYKVIEEGE